MIPRTDSAVDCNRLFVYGTLRRGFRLHHHLAGLGAVFEVDAKVVGELFDLGSYPGATPTKDNRKWVSGELFQLRHAAADLKILDQVEEFVPEAPERSQFVRSLTEVTLSNGTRTLAWIYWVAEQTRASRRIVSGDYAAWRERTGIT
jgi:gamma-glutamylcyclotransferase (GGCT)/AIG2-like uncharacterized protein YtfP